MCEPVKAPAMSRLNFATNQSVPSKPEQEQNKTIPQLRSWRDNRKKMGRKYVGYNDNKK